MNPLSPVEKNERLAVVDGLRGLALFGILLANIPFLENAPGIIPGSNQVDGAMAFLFHLLIDKKFITIFSILFGFGFYIQLKRAEERQVSFWKYFLVKMALLLLIGCLHAYLLWFGDIIRDYAICGIFLLLVYRWSTRKMLITAIIFNVFFTALVFIANGALGLQEYSYDPAIARELPTTDSYTRYLVINATIDPFVNFIQDSPLTLVFCFGNMLIGFLMGKTGFFHHPDDFKNLKTKFVWAGIILGSIASYLFWMLTTGKLELGLPLIWLPFVIVCGMLLQSLFYISAFVILFQKKVFHQFFRLFIPVGRMALSNYLLQTLFYTLLFFHWSHGPSLYGKLTRTETYVVAAFLFSIQVLLSHWWLKRHQHGPVEQAWKYFTYKCNIRPYRSSSSCNES